jgi:hypothetical protein
MYRRVFYFDYLHFREAARPFIERADAGEHSSVVAHANEIAGRPGGRKWILEGHGTGLGELKRRTGPELTGFAFLVLLSTFLKTVRSDIARPSAFPSAARALKQIGWTERDADLLAQGLATTVLLKPDLVQDPLQRPSPRDDRWEEPTYYWWWLRPMNAYYTGWWGLEQITYLHSKMVDCRTRVSHIPTNELDLHPSVTVEKLVQQYDAVMRLFSIAMPKQVGIFFIVA